MTVAFIIFGWPERMKEYGPAYPSVCPNCNNEECFSLVKLRRWLSLYFIPVLPLGRATYYLACGTCGIGVELETKTQVKLAKDLVEPTERFLMGDMSEAEYERELATLDAELSVEDAELVGAAEEQGAGRTPAIESGARAVSGAELLLHTNIEELSDVELEAAMTILETFKQDSVILAQELTNDVYPECEAGYETSEAWWADFAEPMLEDHSLIEKLDDTGRRWSLVED